MDGLPKHFGTDASVDADTAREISAFLERNAGRKRETAPLTRITETRWFVKEHDEVPAAAWKRPAIKSAANCAACHRAAEQGNYEEHDVRIPR